MKTKNIPPLRFPEFKDSGEWEVKTLGEISEKPMYGLNSAAKSYDGVNGYLRITDINEESHKFISQNITSPSEYQDSYLLSEGDLLFARTGASVGKSYLYSKSDGRLFFAGFLIKFTIIKGNPYFIFCQTLTDEYNKWVTINSIRSGQPGINAEEYSTLNIFFPSYPEQLKLADCLSSLDDLISAVSEKIGALKEHKKGLMQQLFPAEGKTTPALRFSEFKDSGEWEETTLGSICSNLGSGKNKSDKNGDYDLYGSTGVIGRTNGGDYDGDYILVARVGANAGLLTKISNKFGVTDNTLVIQLRTPEQISFIYYFLNKVGLNSLVFGSGQPLITGSQLKSLKISLPKLTKEQQKIADCLSSIDEQVAAETQKLDQLKTHKKGLMQQLFPQIND